MLQGISRGFKIDSKCFLPNASSGLSTQPFSLVRKEPYYIYICNIFFFGEVMIRIECLFNKVLICVAHCSTLLYPARLYSHKFYRRAAKVRGFRSLR